MANTFLAKAEYLESLTIDEREQEVLVRTAISQFEGQHQAKQKKIPPEVLTSLNSIDDPASGGYHCCTYAAETG